MPARRILDWIRAASPVRRVQSTAGYQSWRRSLLVSGLRRRAAHVTPLNVVLGSGETRFDGWLDTDQHVLDVRLRENWAGVFRDGSIDRLLAEHLFEHLSEDDCAVSFALCYRYLKPGGRLRIAVPDGYHRDPRYIEEVAPPRDGHKCLFHVDSLGSLLIAAGFAVEPLEYFDGDGEFHARSWSPADGYVKRSARIDEFDRFRNSPLGYTSLIIDAVKE